MKRIIAVFTAAVMLAAAVFHFRHAAEEMMQEHPTVIKVKSP